MEVDEAGNDQRRRAGAATLLRHGHAFHFGHTAREPLDVAIHPAAWAQNLTVQRRRWRLDDMRIRIDTRWLTARAFHPQIIAQKSGPASVTAAYAPDWIRLKTSVVSADCHHLSPLSFNPTPMREAGTRQRAHLWLSTLVAPYLGAGRRDFSFRLYEGEGITRTGEGMMFLSPARGEVIGISPEFIALRTGETRFDVITIQFMEQPLLMGQRVKLRYYDMRRFDGSRVSADLELESESQGASSVADVLRVRFPITWPGRALPPPMRRMAATMQVAQSRALMTLVELMESQMCDTLRNVPSLLVDAGARQVHVREVPEEVLFGKPVQGSSVATLSVTVRTRRFAGTVELEFDAVSGTFCVKLGTSGGRGSGQLFENLQPSGVAKVLTERVDDGRWRLVHTEPTDDALPAAAARQPTQASQSTRSRQAPPARPSTRRWQSSWMLLVLLGAIALVFYATDGAGLFRLLGQKT